MLNISILLKHIYQMLFTNHSYQPHIAWAKVCCELLALLTDALQSCIWSLRPPNCVVDHTIGNTGHLLVTWTLGPGNICMRDLITKWLKIIIILIWLRMFIIYSPSNLKSSLFITGMEEKSNKLAALTGRLIS